MSGRRTNDPAYRPRREPTQERSRATVDAILTAAAQIFDRRGYEGTTTDLIAARAGVSVGSLYQYFPTKDAVLRKLVERHAAEVSHAVAPLLVDLDTSTDLATFLSELTRRYFAVRGKAPRLFQVIREEAPLPDDLRLRLHELESAASVAVASYLRVARGITRNADLAGMMVMVTLEAVTERLTVYPPPCTDVDALQSETEAMLLAYLTG